MASTPAAAPDLTVVHDRLQSILAPYRAEYAVTRDDAGGMTLEVPGLEGRPWGYAAGTRVGKRYVSLYLMPVYADPALAASISPALTKRRQGKSCFNFSRIDEPLFEELAALMARGVPRFRALAEALDAERR